MALIVLIALIAATLGGLLTGRWRVLLLVPAAIAACALTLGPEAALVAALAGAGLGAGIHLHRVVADASLTRTH